MKVSFKYLICLFLLVLATQSCANTRLISLINNNIELLALNQESKTQEAINGFNIAIKESPNNFKACLYLGIAYLKNNEPQKAINLFDNYKNKKEEILEKELKSQAQVIKSFNFSQKSLPEKQSFIKIIEESGLRAISEQEEQNEIKKNNEKDGGGGGGCGC